MKLLPYFIALIFSSAISAWLALPISMIAGLFHAKMYNEMPGFSTGIWLAGIESLILVLFSIWVFSWFGYALPIFFMIVITALVLFNNFKRYNTRPNKAIALGYLIGELFAIPVIYFQFIDVHSEGVLVFW